jgi:hypothetical protein
VEHRHASTSPRSGLRGRFYTFVQSIKNSVNDICKTIPTIILNNKSGINGGGIPKHWNISGFIAEMHDFISSYYAEFSVYKKTNLSPTCWTRYTTRREISSYCANIPLFSPFWNGGESTFYKMFEARYTRVDDVLLVVGVLRYIQLTNDPDLIMTHKKSIKTQVGAEREQGRFNSTRRRW